MQHRYAKGGTLVLGGGFAGSYVARLLGKDGCTNNGIDQFGKINFWKTPKAECGDGTADCVPYHEWVTNYIAVIGGR